MLCLNCSKKMASFRIIDYFKTGTLATRLPATSRQSKGTAALIDRAFRFYERHHVKIWHTGNHHMRTSQSVVQQSRSFFLTFLSNWIFSYKCRVPIRSSFAVCTEINMLTIADTVASWVGRYLRRILSPTYKVTHCSLSACLSRFWTNKGISPLSVVTLLSEKGAVWYWPIWYLYLKKIK